MSWSTEVYGKCILSGEHAVLRGVPAYVVPVKSRSLKLSYEPQAGTFQVEALDAFSESTKVVMWGVIEKALTQLKKNYSDLHGVLKVENTVPFGAGLGASAALCVGVARFFVQLDWLSPSAVFEFARSLENLFHGESSGVDVAVAESGHTIKYRRGHGIQEVQPLWHPQLFLSYSGHKGVTSECVNQVKLLQETDSEQGRALDEKMRQSVQSLEESFTQSGLKLEERMAKLKTSFDQARECFQEWGLTKGNLDQHMKRLMDLGAVACKPTGSGGGGHVLSLWDGTPKVTEFERIPVTV